MQYIIKIAYTRNKKISEEYLNLRKSFEIYWNLKIIQLILRPNETKVLYKK